MQPLPETFPNPRAFVLKMLAMSYLREAVSLALPPLLLHVVAAS
jgi:hypothetical protein